VTINSLSLSNFRNITEQFIVCSPYFNLFYGDNAAGKTSVLEAIYYLATAKSFRTHHHDRVISSDCDSLTLFARCQLENSLIPIGIQRFRDGSAQIKMNGVPAHSISEVSQRFPVQFISSDSHRILSDGPKSRRQFLDWGLFHTNPLFLTQWKAFQKLLIQRNAALKARALRDELQIWNHEFALIGETLNKMRQNYVNDFIPVFNQIIQVLLSDIIISIQYLPGWDQNSSLETCLNQNVSRETLVGHGLFGPHRADLGLFVNDLPAEDVLSQGQQKLVSYVLRLAQGLHLQSVTNKKPIYLIDDLPSELDRQKRSLVVQILAKLGSQVFITGIESTDLQEICHLNLDNRMFHVKHGTILPHVTEECFT